MREPISVVKEWLGEAAKDGAAYLLVVCDIYDYVEYPVPVAKESDFWTVYDRHHNKNMQRVEGVYRVYANSALLTPDPEVCPVAAWPARKDLMTFSFSLPRSSISNGDIVSVVLDVGAGTCKLDTGV